MPYRNALLTFSLFLLAAAGGCQIHPRPTEVGNDLPPAPTPALPYHVSHMRVETLSPATYLYSATRTSFDDIAGPASSTIPSLRHLTIAGVVQPTGPVLFVYHDPSEDASAPFDLDIGLPIQSPPAAVPDGFAVRPLPAFRCATVIYRGPMNLLPRAYNTLIPEMIAAGLVPSDETRESYLVWNSPESSGNVVKIEVGISNGGDTPGR